MVSAKGANMDHIYILLHIKFGISFPNYLLKKRAPDIF